MRNRLAKSWIASVIVVWTLLSTLPPATAAPPQAGPGGSIAFTTQATGNVIPVAIATSSDGTAFMLYSEGIGGRYHAMVSRYTPTGGWSAGSSIDSNTTGNSAPVDIVADAHGNAYASFLMGSPQLDAYVARYVVGEGWQPPDLLDNLPGEVQRASLAVSANGTLFAAWYQNDGAYFSAFARRYTPATGWGPVVNIEALAGHGYNDPSVGVDDAGNAIVVWNQNDGGALMTFANRYVQGSGWGVAAAIETNRSDTVTARVSVGPGGQALAAWTKGGSGGNHVYTNLFTPGVGWGTPRAHVNTSSYLQAAIPLVDSRGDAIVVFVMSDGVRYNGWADHYTSGIGWEGAAPFEALDGSLQLQIAKSQLSSDAAGDFLVVWTAQEGAVLNAYASWYAPGQGWAAPAHIEDTSEWAQAPVGALWPSGDGWTAWAQYNATRNQLWMGSYRAADVTAPSLTVSAPTDGGHVAEPSVWVQGVTEAGASVSANGAAATVAADGSFGLRVALVSGANSISIKAEDDWGNAAVRLVNVTFDDPVPALEAQVAAAEVALDLANAQVASLSAALNTTQAAFVGAQANLTAAQGQVDALKVSGNATAVELDVAQASLAAAQSSVAAVQASQAALNAQLATANANATAAQAAARAAQTTADAAQASAAGQAAGAVAAQGAADSAKSSAASASMLGIVGAALGAAGIAVGAMALMRGRGGGGRGGGEKHKAQMSDVQSNPMYKESGNEGTNPLYEKKE